MSKFTFRRVMMSQQYMITLQRVFQFIRANIRNHKKKYIALSLLIAIGYYVKKRMSMEHLLGALMKVIKVLDYIPLPEPPQYREVPQLQIAQPFNFSVLKDYMDTQRIVKQIQQSTDKQKKDELWKQMLKNVMAGYGFTMGFFDLTQIFGMIKCKYINEFRYFGAEPQFTEYTKILTAYFRNHLDHLFAFIVQSQQTRIDTLDPGVKYSSSDIYTLLQQLSEQLLELTQDVSTYRKPIVKRKQLLDQDVSRLFYTDLQKQQPKPKGAFLRTVGWLWSKLSIPTIQNHEYEVAHERFAAIGKLFKMGLLQINEIRLLFMKNQKAEQLFDLVNQQLFDILGSLSFNQLWEASIRYNTQKFLNRLEVLLRRKGKNEMLLGNYLSVISKICLEEFATPASIDMNKKFLDKELKEALKLKMSEQQPQPQTLRLKNMLVEELLQLKRLQLAKNQLVLKYFHERSGVEVSSFEPKNPSSDKEMREFLTYLSKNQQEFQNPQS